MKPIAFAEANTVLTKPAGMTDEQCASLPVFKGEMGGMPVLLSCFEMSDEELLRIIETKRIWLYVFGDRQPPVALTDRPPLWRNEG